jgi:TolB protein
MRRLLLVLLILVVFSPDSASPQGRIDAGTNIGTQEVRIAFPAFQSRSNDANAVKLTSLFNQVLWDDLDYSGNVALVSRSFYPIGKFQEPTDIKVEDWTKPGSNAQYIVFGFSYLRDSKLVFQTRLWDLGVVQNRELIAFDIGNELTEDGIRVVAHTVADQIVDKLFGGGVGISRTKIAYVATTTGINKEIFVMDYDGANSGALTANRSTSVTPNWSPTGDKIAYATVRGNRWSLDVLNVLDRRISPFPPISGTVETPAWSPDGAKIAYAASVDKGKGLGIYVADWNGRNAKRLTVSPNSLDISPTWNPKTGLQIAFVSDRAGTQQIYIMDAEGTNPRRIINEGGDAENPSWSPDGQYIAFAWKKSGNGRYDIYIHNLVTGLNSQLTHDSGDNERPSWAPDGRHIVFASTRTGRSQIFTMLANGLKVRQVTKTGTNEGPAWSSFIGK